MFSAQSRKGRPLKRSASPTSDNNPAFGSSLSLVQGSDSTRNREVHKIEFHAITQIHYYDFPTTVAFIGFGEPSRSGQNLHTETKDNSNGPQDEPILWVIVWQSWLPRTPLLPIPILHQFRHWLWRPKSRCLHHPRQWLAVVLWFLELLNKICGHDTLYTIYQLHSF